MNVIVSSVKEYINDKRLEKIKAQRKEDFDLERKKLKEDHLRVHRNNPRHEELIEEISRRIFQYRNQEWLIKREWLIEQGHDIKSYREE